MGGRLPRSAAATVARGGGSTEPGSVSKLVDEGLYQPNFRNPDPLESDDAAITSMQSND